MNLPQDPTRPEVSVQLADEYKFWAIRMLMEQTRGKSFATDAEFQAELPDFLSEVEQNQEFWSKVSTIAMTYTAQMGDAHGRSVEYQAVQMAASDQWQFHPEQPKSVTDLLQTALEGTSYGSGSFYRIRWLASTLVPYCKAHGINAVEHIYDDNARAKAQYMAERLMNNFKDNGIYSKSGEPITEEQAQTSIDGETQKKMDGMLAMVSDPNVTVTDMKNKFPVTQTKIPPMNMWKFALDGSDLFVIQCLSHLQSNLVERLLNGKTDLQLGTGQEPFIRQLGITKE